MPEEIKQKMVGLDPETKILFDERMKADGFESRNKYARELIRIRDESKIIIETKTDDLIQ